MKTSNIILVSFIIIVFLAPLFIALVLKNKVSRGEYSVVKNQQKDHERNLKTGDYSVLVIKGRSQHFSCTVLAGDSSYISYHNYGDSVHFTNVNDTLTVSYSNRYYDDDRLGILIFAKRPSVIKAEGAELTIAATHYFRKNQLNVELSDSAVLKLNPYSIHAAVEQKGADDSSNVIVIDHLAVKSTSSEIHLMPYYQLNQLSLDVSGNSKIHISKDFHFRSLTGAISDDTELHGPWVKVKELRSGL